MSGAAVTQKLSQNQKSKLKQLKVLQILKNNRFFKILIFKINQMEIKNNQNILWSAILCFGKPLKTIVSIFISKWINCPRKIISNDLKGFFARNLSIQTRLQRYKNSRLQNFKDTKIQGFYFIYFAVSLDL